MLLQPTRDSFTLQSSTAPAKGAVQADGVRTPGSRTGANGNSVRDQDPKIQGLPPKHNLSYAPEMPPGHFTGVLAPRFPAHPQRQSCPRVQTGARSGPSRLRLPEIGVISYGPALEGMRLPLQRRSRGLLASFLAEQPTRRKSSFQNLQLFQSLKTLKAQANYARAAWPQPEEMAA